MSTIPQNPCQHVKIDFPQSTLRVDQQRVFFENNGLSIENSLACSSCSLTTHKNLQNYVQDCIDTFLKQEPPVFRVSAQHLLSTPPKEKFLTQEEIAQNPSLMKVGNADCYHYPNPAGFSLQAFEVTEETLRVCEQLVFNHPLQKHALVKEGCFAKAEHACGLLQDAGLAKHAFKIFYYPATGKRIQAQTVHGHANWGHHVVAAVEDKDGAIHIFDAALDATKTLLLEDWYARLGGKNQNITLYTSDHLANRQPQDTSDCLIKTSFNEDVNWDNDQPSISSYDQAYTSTVITPYFTHCDLRATLKARPLTALAAAPYTSLLKPTYAGQNTIYSEGELKHANAIKKLEHSLKTNTVFITENDIKNIEPFFLKSFNALFQQLKNLNELVKNASNISSSDKFTLRDAILKKLREIKNSAADIAADPKAMQAIRSTKISDSLEHWILPLKNKQGFNDLDERLLNRINSLYLELTESP